ncbi:DNA-binding anti-repressor SinI [Domibacillus epiphyticus]|nr:DNA-binding anti-repressor SinI [Domibacillus epiphyticus]
MEEDQAPDMEWIALLNEAKDLQLSLQEVREFIKKNSNRVHKTE